MLRTYSPRQIVMAAALAAAAAMSAHAQPSRDHRSADTEPPASTGEPPSAEGHVTPLLTKPLAGVPGKEVSMVLVEYGPGGATPPHRHNADVLVYVLEGTVVMQVAGSEEVTLKAGQTFEESPTDIHTVSRNASSTEPAKILAVLVKDEGAPATLPVSRDAASESRLAPR